MKTKYIIISLVVVFLLVVVSIFIIKGNSQPAAREGNGKIYVKTAPVLKQNISQPVNTSGRLFAKEEKKLSFKIGGIIEKIMADEGQSVKKGQLLARLDQSEISARHTQAKSGYEKAKRDLDRAERLYADSVATLEQLQNARTALDVAKSNLTMAEFNQKHSNIHAPGNGKILKRFAESSELIGAGMPVFYFASSDKDWIVRAGVTDYEIVQINPGDSANVIFDAYPRQKIAAVISEVAEGADPRTGTYEVELTLKSDGLKLISGFVAQVQIYPSSAPDYFLVPVEAFVEGNGKTGFVYSLSTDEKHAIKHPVQTEFIFGKYVAVSSGLENLKTVITEGSAYLSENSSIEVKN